MRFAFLGRKLLISYAINFYWVFINNSSICLFHFTCRKSHWYVKRLAYCYILPLVLVVAFLFHMFSLRWTWHAIIFFSSDIYLQLLLLVEVRTLHPWPFSSVPLNKILSTTSRSLPFTFHIHSWSFFINSSTWNLGQFVIC